MVSVVINDYVTNKRVKLFFTSSDMEHVQSQWNRESETLARLQESDMFRGKVRWSDLTPAHLRLMVARNLVSVGELSEEDRVDDANPYVSSLNFLVCALIHSIEQLGGCHVEALKLNRVTGLEVAVEYMAALQMEAVIPPPGLLPKPKPVDPFSVVVDNTKE